MTVPGETPAVSDVDLDAAHQIFTKVYAQHWDFVRRYIWRRIHVSQATLAEDLAQETFIRLWLDYVSTGRLEDPDNPHGLLVTLARSAVAGHFRRMPAHERPLDFTDPANTPLFPVDHTYAPDAPHLAALAAELEAAMDHMANLSQLWRDKHAESYSLRIRLGDTYHAGKGGLTPERRRQIAEDADVTERAEADLLVSFQDACRHVGELRAEMEAQAGPGWRTPVQQPIFDPPQGGPKDGSVRGDLTATHCPAGHELTLANVHFFEDGGRRCRACRLESSRASVTKARAGKDTQPVQVTVATDALDAARAFLTDPANDHLDWKQAAKQLGLHEGTMRRRLPDVAADRQARRAQRPAHEKNPKLAKARAMLLDPKHDALTVEEVAKAAGLNWTSLYKQLPDDLAARSERLRPDHSDAAARVSAMLLDPDNTMSIADMAASVGWDPTAPYRRVPDAIEARRKMRARQTEAATR